MSESSKSGSNRKTQSDREATDKSLVRTVLEAAKSVRAVSAAVLAVGVVGAGVGSVVVGTSQADPTTEITSVSDGDVVPMVTVDVTGTTGKLSTGQSLWILQRVEGEPRLHPMKTECLVVDSTFRCGSLTLGVPKDHGRSFTIVLVRSNTSSATELLQMAGASNGREAINLPSGVTQMDVIEVRRR